MLSGRSSSNRRLAILRRTTCSPPSRPYTVGRGPVLRDTLKSRWGGGGSNHTPVLKCRPHYKRNEWTGLTGPLDPTPIPILGFQYVYANRESFAESTAINGKDMEDLFDEYVMDERMVQQTIQYT